MFGYEKGSFTGADRKKIGLLEEAGEGTLFLDEIGDMPLFMQAKLLRVLEERSFRRIGGSKNIPFKARVVAATNRDLKSLVNEGKFREDLYFRLNVITLEVPPLRDRKEDIPLLIEYFLNVYSQKYRKKTNEMPEEIMKQLIEYSWPGNVRELRNVVERFVILNEIGNIKDIDSLLSLPLDKKYISNPMSLKEIEKKHIKDVLEYTGWNKSKAAKILGITRTTLRKKIKEYSILPD